MRIYLRWPFAVLWFLLSYGCGTVLCLVRWGNRENFRFATQMASWGMLKVMGIETQWENEAYLNRDMPSIYMGNHQSMLDVMTFGSRAPKNLTLVVKKEIQWVPVFNILMWGSRQLFIDRSNRQKSVESLKRIAEILQEQKINVAIAPEGTRNKTGQGLLPFKKGGFHLAIAAQASIVPVVSAPLAPLYDWEKKRLKPGTLKLRFLEPIPTKGLVDTDVDQLMERVRSAMLKAQEELSSG